MNKTKLGKAAVLFLALMLLFTVLSRAAAQAGIASVTVEKPENKMITHEIRASGKVVQKQDVAVVTEADQLVKNVYVSQGQQVKKGDLLFTLDLDKLAEQLLNQQQELEKQKLQTADAKSQQEVKAQQKASTQAGAKEQYALSVDEANAMLSRAYGQLDAAQQELEQFRKDHQFTSGGGNEDVEATLEEAIQEKSDAYIAAQKELEQLEWKIEDAVKTALENGQKTAGEEVAAGGNENWSENESSEEVRSEADSGEEAGSEETNSEDASSEEFGLENGGGGCVQKSNLEEAQFSDGSAEVWNGMTDHIERQPDETASDDDSFSETITEDGITVGEQSEPQSEDISEPQQEEISEPQQEEISELQPEDLGQSQPADSGWAGFTAVDLSQIEQTVRDSFSQELEAAQKKVDDALAEKTAAEASLTAYQQEALVKEGTENAQSEKQLLANVQTPRQACEDAEIAANKAAVTGGRTIQESGIPDATDSTGRTSEITEEQLELKIKKLQTLKEKEGNVYAQADGVVLKLNIAPGEKTTDTTAVLLADTSTGYSFTAEITKEQEEYIGTGDLVTLTGGSKKQKLEELSVETVTADEEDSELYHVTVALPENSFALGTTATMEFTKKSETYPICVPLSALHLDEKNQAYVLIPQEYDSIMGTETKAMKVTVTVLEKNTAFAALAEGSLSAQQEVIVNSKKAVDDGSRVRISDS